MTAIILGQQKWCILILLLVLIRVGCLRQIKTLVFVFVALVLVATHSCLMLHNAHLYTVKNERHVEQNYSVQPDVVKTNGNLVTLVAKDDQGQANLVYLKARSRYQLRQWQRLTQPVQVQVSGNQQPISLATNENQFNSQQYYRRQGIYNCIQGNGKIIRTIPLSGIGYLHHWRAVCKNYFRTFPTPLNLFCNRLILGFNDFQLGDTIKQVRKLGIIHLFCLSGLHVTVLCNLIRQLLSWMNITRERINTIQLIILPAFWVIGGESISLTRAVLMLELGLLCSKLKIRHCDTWSCGLLIHLILVPGVLLNLGGQLSYLLSFALCHIQWHHRWRQTIDLNLISIPVLLNQTYQIHCLTFIFNYLMIPVFSWVILPGVILCAVCGILFPGLLDICNQGLIWYQGLLNWLSKCPGLLVFGKIPNWVTLLLIMCSLVYTEHSVTRRPLLIFMTCLYVITFVWIHFPLHGEVVFFDIGQGDSILIREPLNRQITMIDTGGQLHFKVPNWQRRRINNDGAQRVSINYLKSKGIHSVDTILLSHSDADHIGYITTVCHELNVHQIFVPAGMEKMQKFTKRIPYNIKVRPVTDQDDIGQQHLRILHPFKIGKATNADSMVLWGQFGNRSFIFTGDLDRHGEQEVLQKYPALRADVIKLGHHGSKTSSDPRFLKQLQPQLAIISAGRHNRYGHPNAETLVTLNHQGIPYWSTQTHGMIKYTYDSRSGQFNTTLKGDEFSWMHLR